MGQKVPPLKNEHGEYAEQYDSLCEHYEYHASEIIFGLLYQYINSREKLLDLGIGTGLSSVLFQKAGLDIYGLDNSEEMLEICRKKNIAHELKLFDLNKNILPYDDQLFDHVIAVGLFHFFKELEKFFTESYRILKEDGTFSFTVKDSEVKISATFDEEYQIAVYGHSDEYVEELAKQYEFKLLKRLKFSAYKDLFKKDSLSFKAYVLRK